MKIYKRIVASLLSLLLVFSLSITAFAANGEDTGSAAENVSYTTNTMPNVGEGWKHLGDTNTIASLVYNETWFYLLRCPYTNYSAHYTSNSNLEGSSMGYIINQSSCPNFAIGNYHMSEVGCEIAATYNALKLIGRRISCSSIIQSFEKNGYLMGLSSCGDLGSDPYAIGDYLNSINANYTKYTNYSSMSSLVNSNIGSYRVYIASFWNSDSIYDGLHTVAFYTTTGDSLIHVYNLYVDSTSVDTVRSFSSFVSSDRFIVGYSIPRS